jgi:hypothetical protein
MRRVSVAFPYAGTKTTLLANGLTPILNVSDIVQSFAWFAKLGWKNGWDWGTLPTVGAVCCGECESFLCQGCPARPGSLLG